ncbi:baseplate protein J-like protein [Vibrio phage 1.029.O._10N.261.55.A7]|nr:baseplate protein J-like protein [Vibrio phage 1.029.O._10N.261.55.A7]
MAEITSSGFVGKTLIQYKTEIESEYLSIDSQWNIRPESIDGSAIAINSEMYANLDDEIGLAYSACDPDTASGQSLVNVAAISGVPKKLGTYSTSTVSLGGVAGTVVNAGSKIRNKSTGTLWTTTSQVSIPSDVVVTCDERGAKTAGVGDLSIIATPVGGWQTVSNSNSAALGRDDESIAELRVRRNNSVSKPGSNQLDNMYGEIASLDGITHLFTDENYGKTTNPDGLDPNSEIVIVSGGSDQEIADAIARKKNPGCGLNKGNSTFSNEVSIDTTTPIEEYTADNGSTMTIGGSPFNAVFFRAVLKTTYVSVNIKKTGSIDDGTLIQRVKSYIVEYWNATLFSGESVNGFDKTGFDIGQDVPAGRLFVPCQKAVGEEGYTLSVKVGQSSSPTSDIVTISYQELATISEAEIVVTIS